MDQTHKASVSLVDYPLMRWDVMGHPRTHRLADRIQPGVLEHFEPFI